MIDIGIFKALVLKRTMKTNSNTLTFNADGGELHLYNCTDKQFYGMIELFGDENTTHSDPIEEGKADG